jgi:glycerol-3-phosphate cytidylyltransferase-like family protein
MRLERYRLCEHGDGYVLEAMVRDEWQTWVLTHRPQIVAHGYPVSTGQR